MAIRLGKLLGRVRAAAAPAAPPGAPDPLPDPPPPAPAAPVYFVGDVHGRADLLQRLLELIDADMSASGLEAAQLVFAGDYVDRGDRAAEVIEILRRLAATYPDHVVCLMGNHERMMLDFLDRPEARGGRWLRNGGLQTLASFSVGGVGERSAGAALVAAAEALRAALPEGAEGWLRALPDRWTSGNLACVHAAADPRLPIAEQDSKTLLWGHPAFAGTARQDGVWVAHGHTVEDQPYAAGGRIAVDTGACFTGRLTAAAIFPGAEVRFLAT